MSGDPVKIFQLKISTGERENGSGRPIKSVPCTDNYLING